MFYCYSISAGVRRYYRKPFVHLPDDTLLLVLQYLSVKDLYKMRLVSGSFSVSTFGSLKFDMVLKF